MSAANGIRIKSGRVPAEDIKEAVQRAKDRAVLLGVSSMLAKHLGGVAFKSGRLASETKKSYDNQVSTQKGLDIMVIKLDRGHIQAKVVDPKTGESYGEYHINPGGEFISYKNPTTPGTEPINEYEWNESVADEIEALLPAEMIKEGLIVSEYL